MALTAAQQAHVDGATSDCRSEMADYLERKVDVVVYRQNECGPDVPPFAIAVKEDPGFWIDCAETAEAATKLAESLGLRVVEQ